MADHRPDALEIMRRSTVIPAEFRASAQRFQSTVYTDRIDRYIASILDHGRCLVLSGAPGCGKTFAGYYALSLAAVINRRASVGAYNVRRLISLSIDDRDGYWHALNRRGLVLWDDLGTEHRGESRWSDGVLCEMIDARYVNRLPAIITTNVSFTESRRRYDTRITSRLQGWGWWCEFPPEQAPPLRATPKEAIDG